MAGPKCVTPCLLLQVRWRKGATQSWHLAAPTLTSSTSESLRLSVWTLAACAHFLSLTKAAGGPTCAVDSTIPYCGRCWSVRMCIGQTICRALSAPHLAGTGSVHTGGDCCGHLALISARAISEALQQDGLLCRNTNLQNADVAKDTWTEGRKYTRTLVQPNGEQLSLIAGLVEEVGL